MQTPDLSSRKPER